MTTSTYYKVCEETQERRGGAIVLREDKNRTDCTGISSQMGCDVADLVLDSGAIRHSLVRIRP